MHELKYDVCPNPNVELDKKRSYMRRTKLRALSSCEVPHLNQLSSSNLIWIHLHVFSVFFGQIEHVRIDCGTKRQSFHESTNCFICNPLTERFGVCISEFYWFHELNSTFNPTIALYPFGLIKFQVVRLMCCSAFGLSLIRKAREINRN